MILSCAMMVFSMEDDGTVAFTMRKVLTANDMTRAATITPTHSSISLIISLLVMP